MNEVSIIIPSKNEEKNIFECVQRVFSVCPGADVMVVDSGLDGTKRIVEQMIRTYPGLRYILNVPDRGKGDAIRNGIKSSIKDIIVQLDADLQFLPEEIPQLIKPLVENKADMTLGSRFMKNSIRYSESVPGPRLYGNKVVSGVCSWLYGQKITDALAGFKAWKKSVTDSFELTSYTYSYEVELFAKALQKKWRVLDVAISTCPRKEGVSTVSVVSSGFNILKDAVKFLDSYE